MRAFAAPMLAGLLLLGCTPDQQTKAIQYQRDIAALCRVAMAFAGATGVGIYIVGGCATEAAIAKLALDPTSLQWLNDLIQKARAR